jgi:tetratricopeptide (TPR) repeat protein
VAHPSREELEAFYAGKLDLEDEGAVVIHLLLERCPQCLAAALPGLLAKLAGKPLQELPAPDEEAAYEAAVDRACEAALREERRRLLLQPQTERALAAVRAGRRRPKGVEELAWVRALRARSWELRFDDPRQMVTLASLAVQRSLALDPAACGGRERLLDEQAEAMAELGNAYRVTDQYREAEQTLARARRLFEQGTRPDRLEARLLDFEASLLGSLHEFVPAKEKLKQVLEFHTSNADLHLAGRALVKLGVYAGYAGDYEAAVRHLEASLKLIDAGRDPVLGFNAAQSLVLFLVEAGRLAEARRARLLHSRHLLHPGGRIGELKIRSIDARIAAGAGRYAQAAGLFRELVEGFAEAGLPILAGIEALHLAAVLLRQGKAGEAAGEILAAAEVFIAYGIRPQAMQVVVMLRDAFRKETGTLAQVEEVAAFLRRLHTDPTVRFEAQAWAKPP